MRCSPRPYSASVSSQAAFEAYRTGPLLKKSFEVLGPMMDGPPDSAYFEASKVK